MISSPAQSCASIGEAQYQTPRPSKRRKVSDFRATIAGAAGDHDAARLNAPVAFDVERQRAVRAPAIERIHAGGNHDFRAELLRLDESPRGQRLTGNSGRKAEVIFDARAGARLAAEGAGVEHHDRQAFGRRIDGRRQPGRTGADDRDVVNKILTRAADHAQLPRERRFRRIVQHSAVGADDQRQAAGLGRIARDQFARLMVGGRVHQMLRIAVAGKKALQPDHVSRIGGTDDDRPAGAAPEERDAAQDQGAHDARAKLGFRDHQRPDSRRRNQQGLDLALRHAVDQGRAIRELPDFGEELARPLIGDRRHMAHAVVLRDGDMACENHEHARARLAGLEQFLAVGISADRPEPPHALDFRRR